MTCTYQSLYRINAWCVGMNIHLISCADDPKATGVAGVVEHLGLKPGIYGLGDGLNDFGTFLIMLESVLLWGISHDKIKEKVALYYKTEEDGIFDALEGFAW